MKLGNRKMIVFNGSGINEVHKSEKGFGEDRPTIRICFMIEGEPGNEKYSEEFYVEGKIRDGSKYTYFMILRVKNHKDIVVTGLYNTKKLTGTLQRSESRTVKF